MVKAACLIIASALSIPAASAWASEPDCKAVANALMLMVRHPLVKQTDTRTDFPGPITTVFAREAKYVSAGGAWKKLDVPTATRIAQMEQALKAQPLKDCHRSTENVGGAAIMKIEYAQGAGNAIIWIDVLGGLPDRWQTGVVLSKMEYTGVVVPVR